MNPPPLFYTLAPVRLAVVEPLAVYRQRGPQLHGFLPDGAVHHARAKLCRGHFATLAEATRAQRAWRKAWLEHRGPLGWAELELARRRRAFNKAITQKIGAMPLITQTKGGNIGH